MSIRNVEGIHCKLVAGILYEPAIVIAANIHIRYDIGKAHCDPYTLSSNRSFQLIFLTRPVVNFYSLIVLYLHT